MLKVPLHLQVLESVNNFCGEAPPADELVQELGIEIDFAPRVWATHFGAALFNFDGHVFSDTALAEDMGLLSCPWQRTACLRNGKTGLEAYATSDLKRFIPGAVFASLCGLSGILFGYPERTTTVPTLRGTVATPKRQQRSREIRF